MIVPISSLNSLSKIYSNGKIAIHDLSLQFQSKEITTTIVGPSKSGKSTLAKMLVGMESISNGTVTVNRIYNGVYVDHLVKEMYNNQDTIYKIIEKNCRSDLNSMNTIFMVLKSLRISINDRISSLLESDRKTFEIIYGMWKKDYFLSSFGSEIHSLNNISYVINNNNNDNNKNDNNNILSYVIVLDEYLDKDMNQIRMKIISNLNSISNQEFIINTNNKNLSSAPLEYSFTLNFQLFIITHSKSTFCSCSDHSIVMHNSRLYDYGLNKKVLLPYQMAWIE
eukprot:gene6722-9215_t